MKALREKINDSYQKFTSKMTNFKFQIWYFKFEFFKPITFAWYSISDILFSCKIDAVKFILFMSEKRFGRELV